MINDLIEDLVRRGNEALKEAGYQDTVHVNVAWTDNPEHGWRAAGAAIPDDVPPMLAESLFRSAEEAAGV